MVLEIFFYLNDSVMIALFLKCFSAAPSTTSIIFPGTEVSLTSLEFTGSSLTPLL